MVQITCLVLIVIALLIVAFDRPPPDGPLDGELPFDRGDGL